MIEYKKAKSEDIVADARGDKEKTNFLKELSKETTKGKDGKERKISMFEIKRRYFEKFYPDQTPAPSKKKGKSIFDLIDEL
ncbi:MAG: hypothetical protein J6T74_00790 [Clostridia bacterium]|nr:hypothetical protein [Clostridia bacterium]